MASRTTTTKKAGAAKAPASTKRTRTQSDTRTPTRRGRATATANANGTAASASSTEVINKSGLPKLHKGGLETQVLDRMAGYPKSDFTPTDLARVLNRSGGAIANALAKFAAEGKVVQTSERPRRYRIAGARTARRASTSKR